MEKQCETCHYNEKWFPKGKYLTTDGCTHAIIRLMKRDTERCLGYKEASKWLKEERK